MTKEIEYIFVITCQCLQWLGVWPNSSSHLDYLKLLLVISNVMTFIFTPQLINAYKAWGNVTRMMTFFSSTNYSLLTMTKIFITRYHSKKLRLVLNSMIEDWTISKSDWERDLMLKSAKRSRTTSLRCWILMACLTLFSIIFYGLAALKQSKPLRRCLLFRVDSIQKSPFYEIILFLQIFGSCQITASNGAVDNFVSTVMLHVCTQLIKLRKDLNNLVNALANKSISSLEFKKGLIMIVERHEILIRNANIIDDCYSSVLFIYVLLTVFQMCSITFQIFTIITDNLAVSILRITFLLFYISVMLIYLFRYCSAAENLMTESTKLVYGAYECNWYDLSAKDAKNLMIIVHRSRIPLRLTAGKFGIFSLEMLGATIKTTMGYLSVLITLRENEK